MRHTRAIERHEPWAPGFDRLQLVMLPESKQPDRTVIALPEAMVRPADEMQTALTAIVSKERAHTIIWSAPRDRSSPRPDFGCFPSWRGYCRYRCLHSGPASPWLW